MILDGSSEPMLDDDFIYDGEEMEGEGNDEMEGEGRGYGGYYQDDEMYEEGYFEEGDELVPSDV